MDDCSPDEMSRCI